MTALALLLLTAAPSFDYKPQPVSAKTLDEQKTGDATVRNLTFHSGAREVKAYLVLPPGKGPFPAVLYVHWLGEVSCDRSEFLNEAVGLAKHGVVSMLIDAPWSEKGWFDKRTTEHDYDDSIATVIELRRALDVLAAQPEVDPNKIAYVGHDFGAMYGALLASVDTRPRTFVLIAGTSHFADWFLLGAKPKDKDAYVKKISELDPVNFIGKTKAPVFFQFSEKDQYVPTEKAKEFFDAAKGLKKMRTYPVDHQMSSTDGLGDRSRWLAKELGFKL